MVFIYVLRFLSFEFVKLGYIRSNYSSIFGFWVKGGGGGDVCCFVCSCVFLLCFYFMVLEYEILLGMLEEGYFLFF